MSLYLNEHCEATSLKHFRLFGLVALLFIPAANARYWEELILAPQLREAFPSTSSRVIWDRSDINILCVVQIMDGLGRKQAEEINRLSDRLQGNTSLVLAAPDRDEGKRPLSYIRETWDKLKIQIPIFDLPPEDRKGIYGGFNPKMIKALPQIIFFDKKRSLLRIEEGFQSAIDIEQTLAELNSSKSGTPPSPATSASILRNGDFRAWSEGGFLPTGWEIRDASAPTFLWAKQMSEASPTVVEIRSVGNKRRQILFQRIADSTALLHRRVRLSATTRSNCIGQPVVALTMPTNEAGRYRFAPESPFVTREGNEIPLRIITALDFPSSTSEWQRQSKEALVPEKGKLFVVAVYLEDPEAPLGAAQFTHISLEILGN